MLKLTKSINEYGDYSFDICTNEGVFTIFFKHNLDLYWDVLSILSNEASNEKCKFIITRENNDIYMEFKSMYNAIKNKQPFLNTSVDEIDNKQIIDIDKYTNNKIFQNNKIIWHSDESPYEVSSYLTIEKIGDTFEVIFHLSHDNTLYNTYSIRFRNSGSRYSPYNIAFMNMYNNFIKEDKGYSRKLIK